MGPTIVSKNRGTNRFLCTVGPICYDPPSVERLQHELDPTDQGPTSDLKTGARSFRSGM